MSGLILGFKVQTFQIFPLGFLVSFKIDSKNYNKKIFEANLLVLKKTVVAIAGPVTNLILAIIFYNLRIKEILNIPSEYLIYANILLFAFNMFPIYPLDGGRILKNFLHIFFGKINALKITILTSKIVAIFLSIAIISTTIYTKNYLYILGICYLWMILIKEDKAIKLKIKMYKILQKCLAINLKK